MAHTGEHLFRDLIFRASNKYASWDPEIVVKAGDYGYILHEKRGWRFWRRPRGAIFSKIGNIYEEQFAEQFFIPPPEEAEGASSMAGVSWMTPENAVDLNLNQDVDLGIPCKIILQFKFTSSQGAVLVMENDIITAINTPSKLRGLLEGERMRGFAIISEVHQCASYVRYVSSKSAAKVVIGLKAELHAVDAGSINSDARWIHKASAGNFKAQTNTTGDRVFYPLFRLVSLDGRDLTSLS